MKRIVLVRPQGPRNVGSCLRLAANFGPAELVLVRPEHPAVLRHPDFVQMAHGVEGGAERVRVVGSLAEALADCGTTYGFTARARDHRAVRDWRDARAELAARNADPEARIALVFGSEENGLTTEETDPLHELVRIPTAAEHTSLNVAMAVGLVLATLFLGDAPSAGAGGSTPLSGSAREFLKLRLMDALGALATSAAARRDVVASVARVFSRAPLETRDARAWHLLARAVGSEATPADYGLPGAGPDDGGDGGDGGELEAESAEGARARAPREEPS